MGGPANRVSIPDGRAAFPLQVFTRIHGITTVLGEDFGQYERGYLEMVAKGVRLDPGTPAEKAARARRERMEAARKAAAETDLDQWDYVAPELFMRDDMRIPMKVGTVRSNESFLKLFCHGLIARLDRPPTFDELERIQTFLDSAEFRQYKNRLNKLMTLEVKERLEPVAEIIGIHGERDMLDVTEEGGVHCKPSGPKSHHSTTGWPSSITTTGPDFMRMPRPTRGRCPCWLSWVSAPAP